MVSDSNENHEAFRDIVPSSEDDYLTACLPTIPHRFTLRSLRYGNAKYAAVRTTSINDNKHQKDLNKSLPLDITEGVNRDRCFINLAFSTDGNRESIDDSHSHCSKLWPTCVFDHQYLFYKSNCIGDASFSEPDVFLFNNHQMYCKRETTRQTKECVTDSVESQNARDELKLNYLKRVHMIQGRRIL